MSRGSSRALNKDEQLSSLRLTGGYDAKTGGIRSQSVDLDVRGGARIRKTLLAKDATFGGNVCATSVRATSVRASNISGNTECLTVEGNSIVEGKLIIQGTTEMTANIANLVLNSVGLDDTLLDGFVRQKVSNPVTLFDSKFLTRRRAFDWDELIEGNSTIDFEHSYLTLSVNGSGDRAIRQSRFYVPYQPGKSFDILITGTLAVGGNADVTSRIGLFDDTDDKDPVLDVEKSGNGYFYEWDGSTVNVVERTYIGNVQTEIRVPQVSWNVDPFDGTGPSGLILDPTKRQIFSIELEWLGVGTAVMALIIRRQLFRTHIFYHANVDSPFPYITRPTLPIRYELFSQGGQESMIQICSTAISHGGFQSKGDIYSVSMRDGLVSIADALTPLVAIRTRPTRKRVTLVVEKTSVSSPSNNAFYVAVYRFIAPPTEPFTGTWTWQDVNDQSAAEYLENSSGSITGFSTFANSVVLEEYYVGTKSTIATTDLADKLGAIVTANIAGTSDIVVIAAGPSGATTAAAAIQWQELE